MKANIIYASRYGSTKIVAGMIAKALEQRWWSVAMYDVDEADFNADVVVLGSGVYANRMLPEMENFIDDNYEALQQKPVAAFGVAMKTEPKEIRGEMFGGVYIFDRYPVKPQVKAVLHGRLDFEQLTEEDKAGLESFYSAIGLSEEEKTERRKLRDEISDYECVNFAEEIINTLTID